MTEAICMMKEQLAACLHEHMSKGLEQMDTHEAGEVVDMIKDLAEAEYYESVVEAMDEENDRAGYTPHKTSRKTRYREEDERLMDMLRRDSSGMYGRAYEEYQGLRRYYTETHNPRYKTEMDAHASEHVGNTLTTIREIWKNADPELRQRMRGDFTALVNEMTV